jgi:biofilm PGA synthesis N-glycosyltransferase PgaC
MNAFLIGSILADRRPRLRAFTELPDVCVLVACYNESENIADTLTSLARQDYAGQIEVVVIDDGSVDDSLAIAQAKAAEYSRHGLRIRVLAQPKNRGKSQALNRGLAETTQPVVITVDGDSYLRADALRKLVERFLSDPAGTVAVAGAVLVRNSRENWLTRSQEWDYFHGIAAVKRMQSMYHGTLVAQGAFSLYTRTALEQVGGWPECVGEDIVVSWALLKTGARIGYCEEACLFTKVPTELGQFARQRQRWSRGLMEAFARHGGLLVKPRMTTLFIWWNLLFLPLDLVYTLAFIPGVILALFGYYWIAGVMTLLVLPLAAIWNLIIFRVQSRMFKSQDLRVRRNIAGFIFYTMAYTMILQPVCVMGYAAELLRLRKTWGTK